MYVVVALTKDGSVKAALGPCENRIQADAIRDVVRCENGETLHVVSLHEPNVFDIHGLSGFADLMS